MLQICRDDAGHDERRGSSSWSRQTDTTASWGHRPKKQNLPRTHERHWCFPAQKSFVESGTQLHYWEMVVQSGLNDKICHLRMSNTRSKNINNQVKNPDCWSIISKIRTDDLQKKIQNICNDLIQSWIIKAVHIPAGLVDHLQRTYRTGLELGNGLGLSGRRCEWQ